MSIALHHILLRSEWLAQDLLHELQLGANFEDLAAEHSVCPSRANEGFAGFHDPDQLPVTLANALQQWDGEAKIIGPIRTDFGFHLLKPVALPTRPVINDDAILSE